VLLIEDDAMIAEAVRTALSRAGASVDWVHDGPSGLAAARSEPFAAVLLDLGLPRRDGVQVLRELRASGCRVPVLVITARDGVADRIDALDSGADDYLVKPFDVNELGARLRAVLRRHDGRADDALHAAGMRMDPTRRQFSVEGKEIMLSAREFSLMELFLRRPGMPLSRSQIEEQLLGWGQEVCSNAVEVQVHNLRRKVGHQRIMNIRGVGYFVPKEHAH
jgi:two-component system response regulator QseB